MVILYHLSVSPISQFSIFNSQFLQRLNRLFHSGRGSHREIHLSLVTVAFEQAEDAKNALEQAKTEEHAKTEGQTEIKNQAEAETSRAAEDQNTVSLEKGSFIDQVVDDQTAAHEEHQK